MTKQKHIFKVQTDSFTQAVQAHTPQEAMDKLIEYLQLPEGWWQTLKLKVEFISTDILK